MAEGWSGIPLTAVLATGNVTQVYPTWAPPGVDPFSAHNAGQEIRHPIGGRLKSVQVETDGTNGGTIEIWDVDGLDAGVDVSSGTGPISNAQLTALIAAGQAKLIFSQDFAATSGARTAFSDHRAFSRGLAARFVGGAGNCKLNLVVDGGFYLRPSGGNP